MKRMKAKIAVLGGDGIGPEVVAEAVRVLEATAQRASATNSRSTPALFGGAAIDATGDGLPPHTLELCLPRVPMPCCSARSAGRSGRPTRRCALSPPAALRRELGVYANLRPVTVHPALRDAS
jgi:3-isopropylmalate dehydrogenase